MSKSTDIPKGQIERVLKESGSYLAHYSAARKEIEACAKVDEVAKIMGKAAALRAYAAQARNFELENYARRIRLRAERKAGDLLKKLKDSGKRAWRGDNLKKGKSPRSRTMTSETLTELGVTKNQSSQWQKIAEVPEANFEKIVESDNPSRAAVLSKAEAKAATDAAFLAAAPSIKAGIDRITIGQFIKSFSIMERQFTNKLVPMKVEFEKQLDDPRSAASDFERSCGRLVRMLRDFFGRDTFENWIAG